MRTKVKMIGNSPYKDWTLGETGYIEGTCRGGDNAPYLVVVLGKKVVMCPPYAVEVISEDN